MKASGSDSDGGALQVQGEPSEKKARQDRAWRKRKKKVLRFLTSRIHSFASTCKHLYLEDNSSVVWRIKFKRPRWTAARSICVQAFSEIGSLRYVSHVFTKGASSCADWRGLCSPLIEPVLRIFAAPSHKPTGCWDVRNTDVLRKPSACRFLMSQRSPGPTEQNVPTCHQALRQKSSRNTQARSEGTSCC